MKRTYRDYLEDMLLSAKEVLEFTAGMSLTEFLKDRKTANAVIRSLEVLGEAAKKSPKPCAWGILRSRGGTSQGCATNLSTNIMGWT